MTSTIKHGLSRDSKGRKTRLFRIWTGIKTRCLNPNDHAYRKYGGRGITICTEWLDYPTFYNWAMSNGYTEKLTIERIDVNACYSPDNCKWITRGEQARNRTNTIYITYQRETRTLKEWSDITGIEYPTLHARINKYGWSIEKAFTTPSTTNRKIKEAV